MSGVFRRHKKPSVAEEWTVGRYRRLEPGKETSGL